MIPLLKIENLIKRYGGATILKNISFEVAPGEVLAFIGPSGSGKTTLLRMVDLLESPSGGKMYFGGIDTDQPESARLKLRRRMAFVTQKPVVFNASVFDNVGYGLSCRHISKKVITGKVYQALEDVGLKELHDRNARTLSGGEAQRVAIARALVLEPELLILDELTTSLDVLATSKIESIVNNIIAKRDTTIIMSTHDLIQGQRLADKIGVLMNGELLQLGSPVHVFNSPESEEIARFVGVDNVIAGKVLACKDDMITVDVGNRHMIETVSDYDVGRRVYASIRPEEITLSYRMASTSARNSFNGTIISLSQVGSVIRVKLDCGFTLTSLVTKLSALEMGLEPGKEIFASFKATGVHIIPRN